MASRPTSPPELNNAYNIRMLNGIPNEITERQNQYMGIKGGVRAEMGLRPGPLDRQPAHRQWRPALRLQPHRLGRIPFRTRAAGAEPELHGRGGGLLQVPRPLAARRRRLRHLRQRPNGHQSEHRQVRAGTRSDPGRSGPRPDCSSRDPLVDRRRRRLHAGLRPGQPERAKPGDHRQHRHLRADLRPPLRIGDPPRDHL